MHDLIDLSPMVVEHPLQNGSAYEVLITLTPDVGDEVIARSPVFYRTRAEAEAYASQVHDALFTARCSCGHAADFVDQIQELDIIGYCSDACYNEAERETIALMKAEL